MEHTYYYLESIQTETETKRNQERLKTIAIRFGGIVAHVRDIHNIVKIEN